ncbi:MAG TPA: tetratricopeptide repeat protein [Desulfomonilaceae bacterium]|nr:tetratricopeptide repeat protein [Desulfomonilaceae bacterium]
MDAVTYPEEKVARFIQDSVIPVRVMFDHKVLARQFNVKWTPTLITLDADGNEHHRTVGFLGPDEFIASQLLGMGKTFFELEKFDEAIGSFNRLLEKYPKSESAAEAVFFRGVSLYKSSHNPKPLREAYDKLSGEYPNTEWTKRAYPYRLIEL